MKHTYINRANSNQRIIEIANQRLQEEGRKKPFKTFEGAYKDAKTKRAIRTLMKRNSDPSKHIHFYEDGHPKELTFRKRARPRLQWNEEALKDLYQRLKHKLIITLVYLGIHV